MEIELLYFDRCSGYRRAEKTLREVLVEQGLETTLKLVAVNNDEEAQRLRFPGSPTIRVEGQDEGRGTQLRLYYSITIMPQRRSQPT